jgi:hypothetical protein
MMLYESEEESVPGIAAEFIDAIISSGAPAQPCTENFFLEIPAVNKKFRMREQQEAISLILCGAEKPESMRRFRALMSFLVRRAKESRKDAAKTDKFSQLSLINPKLTN